jgi:hypothetical protein
VLDEGAQHTGAYAQVHVLERGADLVLVQQPVVVGVVAREGGGNQVFFGGNEPREEEPDGNARGGVSMATQKTILVHTNTSYRLSPPPRPPTPNPHPLQTLYL